MPCGVENVHRKNGCSCGCAFVRLARSRKSKQIHRTLRVRTVHSFFVIRIQHFLIGSRPFVASANARAIFSPSVLVFTIRRLARYRHPSCGDASDTLQLEFSRSGDHFYSYSYNPIAVVRIVQCCKAGGQANWNG